MSLVERPLTRPDSPKVIRERKSRADFDVGSPRVARASPRLGRGNSMQKMMHEMNNTPWNLRYDIENDEYAKGAYGKILLATEKATKQRVVIKKIPHTTPIRMINNEVRAGEAIGSHDNIATFIQYNDQPDFHYMILQYVPGEDMFTYLERLNFAPRTEPQARAMVYQMVDALLHIHSRKIAHRDIKLENLLITKESKVYVIDFGLCAFIEQGKPCKEWCGSDNYLAPEIVRRIPYDGYKADVFSTGVVLFALLFGVFPFENLRVNGRSSSNPLRKIQVRFPVDVKVSSAAKDLLSKMLEDDPVARISMEDIMKHEFIVGDSPVLSKNSMKDNSCESRFA